MPWLVVDVQWSPFAARDYWVVSTANHRALVWNLNMREDSSSGPIEHSLQGHTRAITDVNFSAHHPDLLATCSVDGDVHWWDLRRPRQPVLTFCDWFAGATQVKYNRQDPHIIASAHDRWLHIWDERHASKPVRTITAHTSKIYGLDWNRTRSTGIVTCSLDKSIKFWDYGTEGDEPEHVIQTEYPVWRARHTPFGWGLLAMPQNEPGDLYLYDRLWSDDSPVDASPDPVAIFPGHGDNKATEFLWRSRGGISPDNMDERDFQLVSWGTDNELRLHCIDNSTYQAVGHAKGGPARKGIKLTRSGATYKTFRTVDESSTKERKMGTMSDQRATAMGQSKHSANAVSRSGGQFNRHMRPVWSGPSVKPKGFTSKSAEKSQSHIGWMKGITMNKRKGSTDTSRRLASKDSSILGTNFPEDQWGEPDTIQEELLRVSTQIPKVKWENIDMDNLTLNASLTGPWGVDGEPIFIKVKIDVPSGYPRHKAPKFTIEKSSFIPEDTHKRLHREIHKLANEFLQRKQNCLEVAFTYLLGEVDLESSTSFFKNVRDLDDDMDGLADDSSSEDDDAEAGGSASMSQELAQSGEVDTTIAAPGRSNMPPPPRTCGARFSNNGRLVCFFPTKEEKFRALFSSTGDVATKDRPKNEPFFAGFGRLAQEQSPRNRYQMDEASATDDHSSGLDSDESSSVSSSSDSESTSIHNMSIWYRSSRQLRKTWSEDRSMRSSGAGTGTGTGFGTATGTGTGTSRRRMIKSRNVISIHDYRAELPSKRDLAAEYAIFGDGADVCGYNAKVAEKHGFLELSNVWQYLALLLRKGIPLEVLGRNRRRNSILVIARDVVSRVGVVDEAEDASKSESGLLGRVRWGQHPLAKDLIAELFEYYETKADVQMLAMLACIFSESTKDDSVAYIESGLPQQETPLPLKAPSFSLEYFPSDANGWNLHTRSIPTSGVTTPGTLHTPHYAGSHASDEGVWNVDTGQNSYSCGETPPKKSKDHLGEQDGTNTTLSKSPTIRPLQKTNSGFASAFTANLPRSFTGGMASTSPPSQGKKKPSPAEAILNTLAPRTGSSGVTSSPAMPESGGGRTSVSDEDFQGEDVMAMVPVRVNVILEDQSMFDDDGWLGNPLLDSSLSSLYANYRYAYAEMLHMWEQPLSRLEVMKFNTLKEDASIGAGDGSLRESKTVHEGMNGGNLPTKSGASSIAMGKQDQLQALIASGRGLDVTGVCRVHEIQLEPQQYTSTEAKVGGAVGTCDRCKRTQDKLCCVYCLEPVNALFPTCLSCGCASHEDCLGEWHAAGEMYCPAGDECNCVEEAANGQVESWAALQAAMLKGQRQMMSAFSDTSPSPVATDDAKEKGRGWARLGSDTPTKAGNKPAASPAPMGFGPFKRPAGTWSRNPSANQSQRRGGRRGG